MKVKICGVTTVEDGLAAARLGADFVGLNFYPKSPRCLSESAARALVAALPAAVTSVGLFVNESWNVVESRARELGLRIVQVHGDRLEPCPFSDLQWIPAFPIRDSASLTAIADFLKRCPAERRPFAVLVDAHVAGAYGGTGKTAPWQLMADFKIDVPLILAGGLTPNNVAEAVHLIRPWAVDVASGVESRPGVKDYDKMRRFFESARPMLAAD